MMKFFAFFGIVMCVFLALALTAFAAGFLIWKFTGKAIGFKMMALSQVMPERMHKYCNKFTGDHENAACTSQCKDKFCKYCSKH